MSITFGDWYTHCPFIKTGTNISLRLNVPGSSNVFFQGSEGSNSKSGLSSEIFSSTRQIKSALILPVSFSYTR